MNSPLAPLLRREGKRLFKSLFLQIFKNFSKVLQAELKHICINPSSFLRIVGPPFLRGECPCFFIWEQVFCRLFKKKNYFFQYSNIFLKYLRLSLNILVLMPFSAQARMISLLSRQRLSSVPLLKPPGSMSTVSNGRYW